MAEIETNPVDSDLNIIPMSDEYNLEDYEQQSIFSDYIKHTTYSNIFEYDRKICDHFLFLKHKVDLKRFPLIDEDEEKSLEEKLIETDINIKTDKIVVITRNQLITPELIELLKQYCAIIFINYNHRIRHIR